MTHKGLIRGIEKFFHEENVRNIELSLPNSRGGVYTVTGSYWNGEDWMGSHGRGPTLEEAWDHFLTQLSFTPNEDRQGGDRELLLNQLDWPDHVTEEKRSHGYQILAARHTFPASGEILAHYACDDHYCSVCGEKAGITCYNPDGSKPVLYCSQECWGEDK